MTVFADLTDLPDRYQAITLESNGPDKANLVTSYVDINEGVKAKSYIDMTVYDAIVLRQGLDEFIAQAVGAYV